jgi:hypothetical protein
MDAASTYGFTAAVTPSRSMKIRIGELIWHRPINAVPIEVSSLTEGTRPDLVLGVTLVAGPASEKPTPAHRQHDEAGPPV